MVDIELLGDVLNGCHFVLRDFRFSLEVLKQSFFLTGCSLTVLIKYDKQ